MSLPNPTCPACPACRAPTELVRFQDIAGFACAKCRGHFVRPDALQTFLLSQSNKLRFNQLMQLARDSEASPRPLECPDCGTESFHTLRSGLVEIDVCSVCVGVYFDQHEATRYLTQVRARSAAGNVADWTFFGIDGITALLEFITTFFH